MTRVPTGSDRVAGCILGAAIGDALGHPVEFITSMEGIRRAFGPAGVTGYALFWEEEGRKFAPYTDDTQMAEVVLRSLLASRDGGEALEPAMRRMGKGFATWAQWPLGGHRSPGLACIRGAQQLARGRAWDAADPEAGGCGSVMRGIPVRPPLRGRRGAGGGMGGCPLPPDPRPPHGAGRVRRDGGRCRTRGSGCQCQRRPGRYPGSRRTARPGDGHAVPARAGGG